MTTNLKSLFVLLFLIFATDTAFAGKEGNHSVEFRGQNSDTFSLQSTMTHTEYEYETIQTTCSRQVYVGTRRVCSKSLFNKRRICTRENGRTVCRNTGGSSGGGSSNDDDDDNGGSSYSCRDVADYDTEYYPCTQTVVHSYEVTDYHTTASIDVNFSGMPSGVTAVPTLSFNLDESGYLNLRSKGSPHVIVMGKAHESGRTSGFHRSVNYRVNVKFADVKKVLAPVLKKASDVKVESNQLIFEVGKIEKKEYFELELKAWRVRWFILKDTKLLDRKLKSHEYEIEDAGDKSIVKVRLPGLIQIEAGKKHRFKIIPRIKERSDILNKKELPKFYKKKRFKTRL